MNIGEVSSRVDTMASEENTAAKAVKLETEGSLAKAADPSGTEQPPARGRAYQSKASRKATLTIAGLAVFMVVITLVSFVLGRFPIGVDQAIGMIITSMLPADQTLIDVTWTAQQESLFFNVRLTRILLALMIGACLSAAGAAFQGTFQNPLVSPDILAQARVLHSAQLSPSSPSAVPQQPPPPLSSSR